MSRSFTLDGYRHMREHAGFSYRPSIETPEEGRVRCALALARADFYLHESGRYWCGWTDDDQPSQCWNPETETYDESPAWVCVLYDGDQLTRRDLPAIVQVLGGIDAPEGHPYRRVIEAELMLEERDDFLPAMDRNLNGPGQLITR